MMARALTRTLLTLDRFAQIVGMHPLSFNQVGVSISGTTYGCGHLMLQHGWMNGRVGREEIARAISTAEERVGALLGYDVAPRWNKQELRHVADRMTVKTSRGHVLSGGIEGKTLIDDDVAIVYSDEDADGYSETATVTVSTSVTDPQEIAVYYPGELGSDAWEIRPVVTNINTGSGVATIVFRRHQAVLRDLLEAPLTADEVDGLDDGVFLSVVDVYRHYLDPATQGKLIWEASCCETGGCGACSYVLQNACMMVQDRKLGHIHLSPAEWDSDTNDFTTQFWSVGRPADRAQIWYRAGYYDTTLDTPYLSMSRAFEEVVADYALSLLPMAICECGLAQFRYDKVSKDLSDIEDGRTVAFEAGNTLGRTAGALEAWNFIQEMRIGGGVAHV